MYYIGLQIRKQSFLNRILRLRQAVPGLPKANFKTRNEPYDWELHLSLEFGAAWTQDDKYLRDFYGLCKRVFVRFFIFPVLMNTGNAMVPRLIRISPDFHASNSSAEQSFRNWSVLPDDYPVARTGTAHCGNSGHPNL